MTKRKDERRELLKEDELHSKLENAARYIQQKPVAVLTYLAILLIVVAGWTFFQSENRKKADVQASALYEAEKILQTDINDEKSELKFATQKEKYEAAMTALDKATGEVSGVTRQQALVMKVGCMTSLGRSDGLAEIYQELINKGKGSIKLIGMMGLADLDYAEGRYDEAKTGYEAIGDARLDGSDYEDLVTYKKALCLKGEGDTTAARQELTALVDRYEGEDNAQGEPPVMTKVRELLKELDSDGETAGKS